MNYLLRFLNFTPTEENFQEKQSQVSFKFINFCIIILVVTAFCDIGLGFDYHYSYKFTLPFLLIGVLFNWKEYLINIKNYLSPLWFFAFGILWYALSLSWVEVLPDGIFGLKRFILGHSVIFFGFFLINSRNKLNLFFKTLFVMYCIHLGICFLESLELFRWPISPLSDYLEWFSRKKVGSDSVHYQAPGVAESYPISFFYHPNDAAMITLLGIPFIVRNSKIPQALKVLIFPLAFWLYFKGENKSAIILTSIYVIYLFISSKRVRKVLLSKFSLIALGTFLIVSIISIKFGYMTNRQEFERSGSTFIKYSQTLPLIIKNRLLGNETNFYKLKNHNLDRFAYIDGALKEFSRRPLTGIGVYGLKSKSHQIKLEDGEKTTIKTYPLKGIHFYWIEALAMGGVIFLFAYIIWYALTLLKLFQSRKVENNFAMLESLILFCIGVPVMSQAFFWLPKNLLYLTALLILKFFSIQKDNTNSRN